ncbi:MAG TPA: cytochrome b5 domain-containing protein [Candidatus Bathyarchaeia archaeon]|nr:cytochrome b5 domain-containing protein [Candidatus Bathyarchaeia archaeon]
MAELEEFTLDELADYDGRGGHRAYVAYRGNVYDVTESSYWTDGDHMGEHVAGRDLTAEMDAAPHTPDELKNVKLVGTLAP